MTSGYREWIFESDMNLAALVFFRLHFSEYGAPEGAKLLSAKPIPFFDTGKPNAKSQYIIVFLLLNNSIMLINEEIKCSNDFRSPKRHHVDGYFR